MRFYFLVVSFMNLNFFESMALVKTFGPIVRKLHMEVDSVDLGFGARFCGIDN
jgi:hypothetical protein